MGTGRSWNGLVGLFLALFRCIIADIRIVIVLIAAEILVAAVNIVVDLYAGVD